MSTKPESDQSRQRIVCTTLAAASVGLFHLANTTPWLAPLIFGYLFCLFELSRRLSPRASFYTGVAIGMAVFAPQLYFLFTLFHAAAIPLWLVLAVWIGLFLLLASYCHRHFPIVVTAVAIPLLWLGFEFFRSELYFLRFSWLNVGFTFSQTAFASSQGWMGVYGIGFLLMLLIGLTSVFEPKLRCRWLILSALVIAIITVLPQGRAKSSPTQSRQPRLAGVQLEFPSEPEVRMALADLVRRHPDFDVAVLSEYTFDGPVPKRVSDWCRQHQKYLVVGGKELLPDGTFYNTAFVVGPDGSTVFQQAKSVPIQFFNDGRPAPHRQLWDSPWGKIGLCVCYDLSYRNVIDDLVRLGAQAIIVPTMDVTEWGRHQHHLHSRVAPMRAAEMGVPIFRVCSSGISQAVDCRGRVFATAPFPGQGHTLFATITPVTAGIRPMDHWLGPIASVLALTGLAYFLAVRPILIRRFPQLI